MRIVTISKTIWHDVFYNPSQTVVWFLFALVNPLANLFFWRGAYGSSQVGLNGWTSGEIMTYFLFLILGGGVLLSQIEWDVAYQDIFNGRLSFLVLRPFPYILYKLLLELPWKASQAFFGLLFISFYIVVLHGQFVIIQQPVDIAIAIVIAVLGYLLSFVFKMILGLTALWLVEFTGLQQMLEVTIIVCAGFVMPLILFPELLRSVLLHLPFAFMIYYPIISWIGKLTMPELLLVILYQCFYLSLFSIVLAFLWKRGLRKFTGVGN
jgi:ABC-2 type transport system permease protein